VTVRVLHPEALAGGQRRQRFLQAARAAAGLEHANLVTVHEAGEDGPVCYVASAYCPGITLEAWLAEREEPVPARLAAEVAYALAAAVQHAHSRGVVHGDLGPGHVLLELPDPRWPAEAAGAGGLGYVPRVKDFGLAWALADGGEGRGVLPSPGPAVAGQAGGRSEEGPEAADLRALGAILHELLTGRPPSGAEAVRLGLSGQVGAGEAPAAQGVRHEVPRALQALCLRCLHNGPRPHYLSAQELADELQRFLGGAAG
jgi:serine/threonine protein kinase